MVDRSSLSSKKMIMKEYPYLAFSIKDVKEFIKDLKGKKPEKRITKKYIKELYGIKQLCLTRNYEEGFIDALRYYGYLSDKAKERIDKLAGEELVSSLNNENAFQIEQRHSPQTKSKDVLTEKRCAQSSSSNSSEYKTEDKLAGSELIHSPQEVLKENSNDFSFFPFYKLEDTQKGLKVIDGTPTAISNYLSEREKKGCGKHYDDNGTWLNCGDKWGNLCPACSGEEK